MRKKINKHIALVLVMSLLFEILPIMGVEVKAADIIWDGVSEEKPELIGYEYKIYTATELAWFADQVNSGNDFDGESIYISGNIDLNKKEWPVIGKASSANPAKIKGNIIIEDAVISNLYISKQDVESKGLFGSVEIDNIYIDNLVMENVEIAQSAGSIFWGERYYDGGLFGSLKIGDGGGCEIKNSHISGTFASTSKCGALAGQITDMGRKSVLEITNCDFETVSNTYGIAFGGEMNTECKGGVIAGVYADDSTSQLVFNGVKSVVDLYCANCYGYNASVAGGIIGELKGKSNVFVYQCGVEGKIKSNSYSGWAGGIIGKMISCNTYKQSDSYVTALIDSNWNAYGYHCNGGGFIGGPTDSKPDGYIKNSFYAGKSSTATGFIAKDCIKGDKLKIYNSYYNKNLLTTDFSVYHADFHCYEITGTTIDCNKYTTEEMGIQSNFVGWDFENIWIMGEKCPELRRSNFVLPEDFIYNTSEEYDSPIVKIVREYTSQEMYSQWEQIWNSDDSNEEKFNKILELASNYGITDPKEGLEYVITSSKKRWAYNELISDDLYTATNFLDWLDKGGRNILVIDGLMFNSEIGSWLNPSTYIESDYPGVVKYKDMLYDYMNFSSINIETMKDIKMVATLSKNVTDASQKIYVDECIEKLSKVNGQQERWKIIDEMASKGVFIDAELEGTDLLNSKLSYKLDSTSGFGKYAKALGLAKKSIDLFDMSIKDIEDMVLLDSKLETYYQFESFLNDIIEAKDVIPVQLRAAAMQVQKEINEGYYGEIKKIAGDFLKQTKLSGTIKKSIQETLNISSIASWIGVVDLEAWFINQVVDVGTMEKRASYVEGYAYLEKLYKSRLEESAAIFNDCMTEENAWNFYYNYNMLYSLRYQGEQAYLKMHDVEGIGQIFFENGYAEKAEATNKILDMLKNDCRFDLGEDVEVPEELEYLSKLIVACPVDVRVTTEEGNLIAELKDGELQDTVNDYGRFVVVYNYSIGNYQKIIYLKNEDVNIEVFSQDDGLVSMTYSYLEGGNTTIKYVNNWPMRNSSKIVMKPDVVKNSGTFSLIETNGKQEQQLKEKVENIDIDDAVLSNENIELKIGESILLTVSINPENASNQNMSWYSASPNIASVKDGKVTACKEGKTKVYAFLHGKEKPLICEVQCVASEKNPVNNITGGDSSIWKPNTAENTGQSNDHKENEPKTIKLTKNNTTIKFLKNSYTYDGKAKKPTVKVFDSQGKLLKKSNYTVTYLNNVKVGKATVTIKFKGNYTGTIKKTFTIKPSTTPIIALSSMPDSVTLIWKKQSKQSSGYQIQYATNKKFTKNKQTVTIVGTKKTSKKITRLSKKTTYYCRVRTYKIVNGKTYYSGWSKVWCTKENR